ncbi:hypothetical protein [Actinacidiphila sp. ITFR-21]|uniref:hypothetical protein n=1 Tax=Actinacidiphila sp. ITFR-21 TaxID=3075199 RepID=UPI00288A2789|nr:hypothetical protein [Streptomyces sp. ITFR-21]WNI19606.1 hypothetical protein RLT57_08580 [Streptomyces sp. ITFR-21]
MSPVTFWDMTLHQLMTLIDRHRLATASSQPPAQPGGQPDTGVGVLGLAAVGAI